MWTKGFLSFAGCLRNCGFCHLSRPSRGVSRRRVVRMTVELAVRADDSLRCGGVEVEEVVPARGEYRDGGSGRRPVGIGGSRRTLPVAVGPGQRRLTRALTGRWHRGVDGIVVAAG